jgi:WD40 repeat protein
VSFPSSFVTSQQLHTHRRRNKARPYIGLPFFHSLSLTTLRPLTFHALAVPGSSAFSRAHSIPSLPPSLPPSLLRYMSSSLLVSASTDNSVRLWDLSGTPAEVKVPGTAGAGSKGAGATTAAAAAGGGARGGAGGAAGSEASEPKLAMTYSGHRNERNFVGLSVTPDGYIACGSETNQAFCYYKALPMPFLSHTCTPGRIGGGGGRASLLSHGAMDSIGEAPDLGPPGQFVSAVCWSGKGDHLLAANSVGVIQVLSLE